MPTDEDHDHDRHQPGRVGLLAVDVELRADRHDAERHEQLAGQQAAPGERPALLQAADEVRHRRRQHDVAQQPEPAGADRASRLHQDRRHVVDAGDQAVGDRRCGAEHDDERDRPLGELEQQDGQREPGDRRHRLQAGDQRADRRAGDLRRHDDGADQPADDEGQRVADHGATHRRADRLEHACRRRSGCRAP